MPRCISRRWSSQSLCRIDKNASVVQRGIGCKKAKRALLAESPQKRIYVDRSKGEVLAGWRPLAR
eukprot:808261-Pyramimonas_sp.AAC.1